MYASQLVSDFLKLSDGEIQALPTLDLNNTNVIDTDLTECWIRLENVGDGYLKYRDFACIEAVDQVLYGPQDYFCLRYFGKKQEAADNDDKKDIKFSDYTDIVVMSKKGDKESFTYLVRHEERGRRIKYGYHDGFNADESVDSFHIYYGHLTVRDKSAMEEGVTSSKRVEQELVDLLESNEAAQTNRDMLAVASKLSRCHLMSKNNYVNIHYTWAALIAFMQRHYPREERDGEVTVSKATWERIDRAWVYCEGIKRPDDFGLVIDDVGRKIVDKSVKITDEEIIKSLPGYTDQTECYRIDSVDLFNIFKRYVDDKAMFKIIGKIDKLRNIDRFHANFEWQDYSFGMYSDNRFRDLRHVIRNMISQFYSDNSAFDFPTSTEALREPYDDRDCYSEVSNDFYCEPCVLSVCRVRMADGSYKTTGDVIRGDRVATPDGPATVRLVVETAITQPTVMMRLGSLVITPAHPIRVDGKWVLPDKCGQGVGLQYGMGDKIYSFALDQHHVMYIEDHEVICLAHNFSDPVVRHEYLGTERVMQDLAKIEGFSTGKVCFESGDFKINKATGEVKLNSTLFEGGMLPP